MTIRFDASDDAVVEGPHPVDAHDRGGWTGDDETLWYLTDDHSNGRWLFVDVPSDGDGGIPLGILDSPWRGNGSASGVIYTKRLSAKAAKSLAGALLVAAAAQERIDAAKMAGREEQARRVGACEADGGHLWGPPPLTTTHATGAFGSHGERHFVVCVRCGYGTWLDGDAYRAALPLHRPVGS